MNVQLKKILQIIKDLRSEFILDQKAIDNHLTSIHQARTDLLGLLCDIKMETDQLNLF